MKKTIFITLLFTFSLIACPQSGFDSLMKQIETNNTTLKAYDQQRQASRAGNHTGINMENPEVEFGRMWGTNSKAEGYKYDVGVTQTFDFPTAYHHKKKLAKDQDQISDLTYLEQRNEILNEARIICIELLYQKIMCRELLERKLVADQLFDATEKRFKSGDIDVLERNKAKINQINAEKALQLCEVEVDVLTSELTRINGGVAVEWTDVSYPVTKALPISFEDWYASIEINNPSIKLASQQIEASKRQEQLTKSLNLPKISAGYRKAYEAGGHFSGFVVGMSIPLWGGKNTVKQRKAETVAMTVIYEDTRLQFRNELKKEYEKAIRLEKLLKEYDDVLNTSNNHELMLKAFNLGQLSLVGYLQELSIYYELKDSYYSTEKDYYLAWSELMRWDTSFQN